MYCGFKNYVLSSQLTKQIVFTTRRIIYIMFDIITDSACDIVREYAETHNLKLVPLYTTFDGVNYLKEQYDITHDEFYRRMTDEGAFPKSSLPSVQDFVDAIMPSVEAGRPAIVCTITSYFSGSYNSACTAKDIILEDHPDAKVTVINSLLNSASFSLFIYQALQMRKAGYSYEDTIKVLEALRNDGRIMFTTESLEYLSKGGRLAKTAITITSKLSLRPIIVMKEGEIGLGGSWADIPNTNVGISTAGKYYSKSGTAADFEGMVGERNIPYATPLHIGRNAGNTVYTQMGFRQLLIFNKGLSQAEVNDVLRVMFPA